MMLYVMYYDVCKIGSNEIVATFTSEAEAKEYCEKHSEELWYIRAVMD